MTIDDNTREFTTIHPAIDAPTPPVGGYLPPPAPRNTPKRGTAAMVVGAVILGSGFLTAVSGGALLGLFGDGQVLSSGQHPITTSSSAVVTDLGHIDGINGLDFVTGAPTLHISAESVRDSAVFVGVGPTAEVERYLDGVETETVTDFTLSPFDIDTVRTEGSAVAEPPTEQDFWTASSSSSDVASIAWQIEDGNYEIVIMNADGSAGVLTAAEIGASLPSSTGLWIFVLILGVLFMAGGGTLLAVGARRDRTAQVA